MRFLCRGIHDTYRKIFRRIGFPGVSALSVRRTVATRLFERGAAEEQIGEILGISDKKSVRELLPKLYQPLQAVVRELVCSRARGKRCAATTRLDAPSRLAMSQ